MPVFPGFAFQVSLYFVTVRNVDEDSLPVMVEAIEWLRKETMPLKSELLCYFEIQLSDCLRPNCLIKHFKPRNVSTLGTSSMPVMSTTQTVVAVRPSVCGSTNLVQAQDMETPNFLGAVKEGMTSLSAQSGNKGTSNLTVSGQIVTPTKPIAAKKKARAERFGLKTLPHPQRNISPTTSIPTIPVKPLTSSTAAALTSTHQHVTNTTKAIQTTKQSKQTTENTKSENKDATSTAESEKSKPGTQQIVWDLDGKKKDTLPIKSPTINKPSTDVQKPKNDSNSIDISNSDRDTNRSENPSSSSVNDKRKLQEIKWHLGDVKRFGVLSVGTLLVRMKRRASEGGATNESNRQNVSSSSGGNDEGQKGQTGGASGASGMKIRLTAKAT
ncbi:rho GTPase-activating protein gacF-like [Corticium candelabrum]|uniref:rho GTPase-activating protein gacF-like n=1 Tax=Corticium candelabrum TaxID=121492 RepID=UPI002E26FFCA|nr:rho GTPase-activating protein gacF-like [Corticium candelabrum]